MIVKNVPPVSQKGDDDCQVPEDPNSIVALPKASRFLGLRVRILPAAWMNVSCERCVLLLEASATDRSLVQGCPTDCVCVVQCDHVKQLPHYTYK